MLPDTVKQQFEEFLQCQDNKAAMDELFIALNAWCGISENPVVMLIDEVDSASDNQAFLNFLGLLREGYLSREAYDTPAFHSVILAGVTDVNHLKGKIRPDADQKENSSWNITADFDIDMSLSEDGIKGMLDEYEADHQTGMDTAYMAKLIWEQTSGYPFLVSRICQLIDEKVAVKMSLSDAWTKNGFLEALELILSESNTLFYSIIQTLNLYPELKDAIRSILMEGIKLTYNSDRDDIVKMEMYGLIRNDYNCVKVANRIFETRLYNLFLSDDELNKIRQIKESDGKELIKATV